MLHLLSLLSLKVHSDEAVASEEASNKETLTQTENEETESESAEK